jgi:SET domain-containing protein
MTPPSKTLQIDEAYKSPAIVVRRSPIHRWGVYAKEAIKRLDILEEVPYFVVSSSEIEEAKQCERYSYMINDEESFIGLGYAGLYNHSSNANAVFEIDFLNELVRHYAIRDIEKDEEITINYGEENVAYYNLTG